MEIFLKTVEILKRYKLVSLEWPIRILRIIPSVQKGHFTWSHSLVIGVSFPLTRTFSVICECVSMWGVSMFVNNMFFAYFSCPLYILTSLREFISLNKGDTRNSQTWVSHNHWLFYNKWYTIKLQIIPIFYQIFNNWITTISVFKR